MSATQTSQESPGWMTVDQTANYLGLSRATIYQYVSDRRIPHFKIPTSNQVRFDKGQIDQWMINGGVPTIDEALAQIGGDHHGVSEKT